MVTDRLKNIVGVIPFFLIIVYAISGFISSTVFYDTVYPWLPDIVGSSVATNIVLVYLFSHRKYCLPTKFSAWALLSMNIVSLLPINSHYNAIYDIFIATIVFIVALIFYLKK